MTRGRLLAIVGAVAVAVVAIVVIAIASSSQSGPATIAPADTLLYAEATIRPQGEAKSDVEGALSTLLDSDDPGGEIINLVEKSVADEDRENLDFEADIEPWLGDAAGMFINSIAGEEPDGAVVVETTDGNDALEFMRERRGSASQADFEGTTYEFDREGNAYAVIDGFLVVGTESGLRDAIDAAGDGESLADLEDFDSVSGELRDDALAGFYLVPDDLVDAAPVGDFGALLSRRLIKRALGDFGMQPVTGALDATGDSFTLDLTTAPADVLPERGRPLIADLPERAWLAFALPDLSDAANQVLDQIGDAGVPGLNRESIESQIRLATGLELSQILDALGDASLFVSGSTADGVGGALVIESEDPDLTAELIDRVRGLLSSVGGDVQVGPLELSGGGEGFDIRSADIPKPVHVIQRDERIVIGYGDAQTLAALDPEQTLDRSDAFERAGEALGDAPLGLFLSLQPIIDLAEASGAKRDPDFKAAKPYLDHLDFVAAGASSSDDRSTTTIVLGLRD